MQNNILIKINKQISSINLDLIPLNVLSFFQKILETEVAGYVKGLECTIQKFEGKEILILMQKVEIINGLPFFNRKYYEGTYSAKLKIFYNNKELTNINEIEISDKVNLNEIFTFEFIGFQYSGLRHDKIEKANLKINEGFDLKESFYD